MVRFLTERPVAVSMVFLAMLILGGVAASYLPVSLVPDVDIPRISVRVDAPAYSSRQIEERVMNPLRVHLMQVNGLHDLKTESRDGNGMVTLEFEFGTSIDLAYIEVNEQVDKASSILPRDIQRPAVVKASASDIPVFYLDIHYSSENSQAPTLSGENNFQQLSTFADEIIRRRLEQIPQVAMADMSGRVFPEIIIKPRVELLQAMNMQPEVIENLIRANNVSLGNIMIRDKQYQYNVRVGSPMIEASDIGNLYLNHEGRLWQLKELCHIESRTRESEGMIHSSGNRAITLAIIKQADARMQDLRSELKVMMERLEQDYPDIAFAVYRDQTMLLGYTLDNLRQTLIIGSLLALVIMFLFLGDARSPWLIVISVPAAIIISLLFFFLAGISVNIVSLSGLILSVGMMIDNSIIVIDNITRYRKEGLHTMDACVKGTNEVFRPLLSSVLTTCSVFIPLIFLGGLAGALFFDQAVAVSIGLLVSLLIAMTLIPVYYNLIFSGNRMLRKPALQPRINKINYDKLYDKGFRFTMRRQKWVWTFFLVFLLSLPMLYIQLEKEQLPAIKRDAALLRIDWNENIHVEENYTRVQFMMDSLKPSLLHSNIQTGRQQFLMDNEHHHNRRQNLIYLQTASPAKLESLKKQIADFMVQNYPQALFGFQDDGNLFDQVFASQTAPLEVRLRPVQANRENLVQNLQNTIQEIDNNLHGFTAEALPLQEVFVLQPHLEHMALHHVTMNALHDKLTTIFNENQIIALMDNQNTIPVKLGNTGDDLQQILQNEKVTNSMGIAIPLPLLLTQARGTQLQTITAGLEGEYFPIEMNTTASQFPKTKSIIDKALKKQGLFEAGFAGSIFEREELIRELLLIGLIALLLLFFILAAQFESLKLPLIVLLEVPVAMAGGLFLLLLSGNTLNVMSMIGLVVMTGIIINDSILKIDTVNRLRSDGMPLLRALHTAGHYRLKPILMTSITTIFALLPFLFTSGLGADLQKPLALVVIGGLGLGTLVSLYFVPLCYYLIFRDARRPTTLSRRTTENKNVH